MEISDFDHKPQTVKAEQSIGGSTVNRWCPSLTVCSYFCFWPIAEQTDTEIDAGFTSAFGQEAEHPETFYSGDA
jgi:hypothetical protein